MLHHNSARQLQTRAAQGAIGSANPPSSWSVSGRQTPSTKALGSLHPPKQGAAQKPTGCARQALLRSRAGAGSAPRANPPAAAPCRGGGGGRAAYVSGRGRRPLRGAGGRGALQKGSVLSSCSCRFSFIRRFWNQVLIWGRGGEGDRREEVTTDNGPRAPAPGPRPPRSPAPPRAASCPPAAGARPPPGSAAGGRSSPGC